MGLLSEGTPLSWNETKKHADHVRRNGILQFINIYNNLKGRKNDHLKWGDEVEYMLVKVDEENKTARLLLKAHELLPILQEEENKADGVPQTLWRPEYADYMVEGVPGQPYGHLFAYFNMVEANQRLRRQEVQKLLGKNEYALTLTSFARLGCPNFCEPNFLPTPIDGLITKSLFVPDEAIFSGHPRFGCLTRNIRERRGSKVVINLPEFQDARTPLEQDDWDTLGDVSGESRAAAKPRHIYMDAMCFGMGCSCLQMTFQACSLNEAFHLYDQLTPLCPIVMALSAASPIHRGRLSDNDCRWSVISASVDDRTPFEASGLIKKSRYDSISSYLSPLGEPFNDINLTCDSESYETLREAGIGHLLAQHIAHLFIRDPIVLYEEKLHLDNTKDSDHFENLQSTNWQSMRFKPPPANSSIGWRVEFRPTEVQLTDFENAAFVVFVVLLTRVILTLKLNLIIPISKVDENMKRAQHRDAVLKERFYFRRSKCLTSMSTAQQTDMTSSETCSGVGSVVEVPRHRCSEVNRPNLEELLKDCCTSCTASDAAELMSIDEIVNGGAEFPGLVPLCIQYLNMAEADVETVCTVTEYLRLIQLRASGDLQTTAAWQRSFVQSHPDYAFDSRVSERICFDLTRECARITEGTSRPQRLLPRNASSCSSNDLSVATLVAEQKFDERIAAREAAAIATAAIDPPPLDN